MFSNEEWTSEVEVLEIMPKIYQTDYNDEPDRSSEETGVASNDYAPALIDEYLIRR